MFESIPPSEEIRHQSDHKLDYNDTVLDAEIIISSSRYNHMPAGRHLKETACKVGRYLFELTKPYGCVVCGIPVHIKKVSKKK